MLLPIRDTRCCAHCCLSTFVSRTRGRALQTSPRGCRRVVRSLTGQTQVLALAAGPCFDPSCQQKLEQAFGVSKALPLTLALIAFLLLSRKPSWGQKDLQDHADALEKDVSGNLALKAVSYTAWPVTSEEEGERLRLDVGPVDRKVKRTFVFKRVLQHPSELLAVSLPSRPLGIIFEEDASGRVVVFDIIKGTVAYQRCQVSRLSKQSLGHSVQIGDVLRACTCTNFLYETSALLGAKAPVRTTVLYGADNQQWPKVMIALKRGEGADGEVVLVLERPLH